MADQTEKPKLGTRPPLGIKRTVETGKVKQSFSHGRSNTVVVERKQRRVFPKPGEAPPPTPARARCRSAARTSAEACCSGSSAAAPAVRDRRDREPQGNADAPSPRGGGSPPDRARGCAPPRGTSQGSANEEERRRAEENRRAEEAAAEEAARRAEEEALAATAPPPSEDAEPAAVSVPEEDRGAQLPPSWPCACAEAPRAVASDARSRRSPPFWEAHRQPRPVRRRREPRPLARRAPSRSRKGKAPPHGDRSCDQAGPRRRSSPRQSPFRNSQTAWPSVAPTWSRPSSRWARLLL